MNRCTAKAASSLFATMVVGGAAGGCSASSKASSGSRDASVDVSSADDATVVGDAACECAAEDSGSVTADSSQEAGCPTTPAPSFVVEVTGESDTGTPGFSGLTETDVSLSDSGGTWGTKGSVVMLSATVGETVTIAFADQPSAGEQYTLTNEPGAPGQAEIYADTYIVEGSQGQDAVGCWISSGGTLEITALQGGCSVSFIIKNATMEPAGQGFCNPSLPAPTGMFTLSGTASNVPIK